MVILHQITMNYFILIVFKTLFLKKARDQRFKDTPVIQASRHGLRVDICMKKRFGRFSWFFRNIIFHLKGKICWLDFSCKSLYLTVFCAFKKPSHNSDMYGTPRDSPCIIFISASTWCDNLKTLDWIFWNNAHSAFNHAFSKVSPKIE